MENMENVKSFSARIASIKAELAKDVVGNEEVIENIIIAIISGGNVLLEGVPGVGKTRLVRSLSRTLGLPFSRIQFTPDLMPSDVTGTNIIQKDKDGNMHTVFQRGPIFANLVLADEINRATPKTQSAMLEVMQEHKVTVGGETYTIDEPFFVMATENPIEQDGTYPLPEAQMDRFMFKLIMKFPGIEELKSIVTMTQATLAETAEAVIDGETILGSHYEEGLCDSVRCSAYGNLVLLHYLKHRSLSLRSSSVDFVSKNEICENRTLTKNGLHISVLILLNDVGTGYVRWHKVGCELNS